MTSVFPPVFPTCTFFGAAGSLAVHPQLADEVLLPELSEPDVPAVVGQGAAPEVTVKRCGKKESVIKVMIAFRTVARFVTRHAVSCLTVHGRPLGEDGDGALGHLLLLDHWRDLGAPAVRAHPQEVTCQVVAFRCIQDSPSGSQVRQSI